MTGCNIYVTKATASDTNLLPLFRLLPSQDNKRYLWPARLDNELICLEKMAPTFLRVSNYFYDPFLLPLVAKHRNSGQRSRWAINCPGIRRSCVRWVGSLTESIPFLFTNSSPWLGWTKLSCAFHFIFFIGFPPPVMLETTHLPCYFYLLMLRELRIKIRHWRGIFRCNWFCLV